MGSNFLADFLAEFTWAKVAAGVALTILGRGLLWVFGKSPKKELAFWGIFFASVLSLLAIADSLTRPQPIVINPPVIEEGGPKFSSNIDTVGWAPLEEGRSTKIILIASIRNVGQESSAVEKWKLVVQLSGAGERQATGRYIPPERIITLGKLKLSGDDALYDKATVPIPAGGLVRGLLIFDLEGIAPSAFGESGTLLKLSFTDIKGKQYTAEYEQTGERESVGYLPGLRPMK